MIDALSGEPVTASTVASFEAGTPLPEGRAKQDLVRSMFDSIAPRYALVNRVMTFGLDSVWRSRTIALLGCPPGSTVLDIGCGTGDLARNLRRKGQLAVGLDLSLGMLASARSGGAPLVGADAAALPLRTASADAAVSGFAVRNFADLAGVLRELGRVLRPGGRLALLEVDEPKSRLLRLGHHVWFTYAVPRIGALLSNGAAYRYLPRSVAYLPSLPELVRLLHDAGFTDVSYEPLSGGIAQCVTATRTAGGAQP